MTVETQANINTDIGETIISVKANRMATKNIPVRIPKHSLQQSTTPITFTAHNLTDTDITLEYKTVFKAPTHN
ncbi:FixG Ig-like domain-containing protein [Pseudomonadota bacterium]